MCVWQKKVKKKKKKKNPTQVVSLRHSSWITCHLRMSFFSHPPHLRKNPFFFAWGDPHTITPPQKKTYILFYPPPPPFLLYSSRRGRPVHPVRGEARADGRHLQGVRGHIKHQETQVRKSSPFFFSRKVFKSRRDFYKLTSATNSSFKHVMERVIRTPHKCHNCFFSP